MIFFSHDNTHKLINCQALGSYLRPYYSIENRRGLFGGSERQPGASAILFDSICLAHPPFYPRHLNCWFVVELTAIVIMYLITSRLIY